MHIGLVDLRWRGHHTPYVVYLSRYFTEHGHDVTFITDENHEHLDELPESNSLTVEKRAFPETPSDLDPGLLNSIREQYLRTRQLRVIFEMARETDVDVIHFLYFDRTQVPLRLATLGGSCDIPVIVTLHRDAFLRSARGNLAKRATQLVTTLAIDSSLAGGAIDVITVHSDSIRDRIIGAVDSATRTNTRTVPAPTPDSFVDGSTAELRAELNLPQDKDLILFFGGLRHEKGPDLLANAASDIKRPLAIVYAGSPVDFTEADVERWKQAVEPPVEIIDRLEYIPESDVDAFFATADALVLPYRRTHGISGPLRRAAMAGTPAIGPTRSDIGDIIERYDLGATFDPSDSASFERALERVLDEDASFSAPLRKFASTRHWTETGAALADIYNEAMENLGYKSTSHK